jgi:hypothetical protein
MTKNLRFFLSFILLYILCSNIVLSQTHTKWIFGIGGSGDDIASINDLDQNGNIITVGSFNGTVDFDPGQNIIDLNSSGTFIYKTSPYGQIIWVKAIPTYFPFGNNPSYSITCFELKVDHQNNIYITGYFNGSLDFDPNFGNHTLSSVYDNSFIAKYDSSGSFLWVKQIKGNYENNSLGLFIDKNDNIYFAGYFRDTIDADPGIGVYSLSTQLSYLYSMYITKLDKNGNFIWAKTIGGPNSMGNSPKIALTVDKNENVFVTAQFFVTNVDFDPGPNTVHLPASSANGYFILKLDSIGNYKWVKSTGNGSAGTYDIKLDGDENIVVGGGFNGTVDFDSGPGQIQYTAPGNYKSDIFISKYDSSGTLKWVRAIGGAENDNLYSIGIDKFNNIYACGIYKKVVDFDPGIHSWLGISVNNSTDGFMSKYDPNGNFTWATTMGSKAEDGCSAVVVNEMGDVILTGWYRDTAYYDQMHADIFLTPHGGYDFFVSKYGNMLETSNNESETKEFEMKSYPNPVFDSSIIEFFLPSNSDVTLNLLDIQGNLITTLLKENQVAGPHSIKYENKNLSPGIYCLKIETEKWTKTNKMVVVR